jgi:hypothetical protein
MKPLYHAQLSVKKYGGIVEDYLPVHNFFDSSKDNIADVRHRAMLHSTWGIFLVEKVFGEYITNSDGKKVCVRDLGEDHVAEDMGGKIPTMEQWLRHLPIEKWMHGRSNSKHVKTVFRFDYD